MLAKLLLVVGLAGADARCSLAQVRVLSFDRVRLTVSVALADQQAVLANTHLVLVSEDTPVGWFELAEIRPARACFRRSRPIEPPRGERLRAWLVPPDLGARLLHSWPVGGPLVSAIESVSATPGGWRAWVSAGTDHGITPGMSWLHRTGEQPTFRLDVRSAERALCYCAAIPLAEGAQLHPGDRVELWPSPAHRRRGSAETIVCYVDLSRDAPTVWLPAPPDAVTAPDCVAEFWRGGEYIGHGVIEARDELFWYARFVAGTWALTGSSTTSRATQPAYPLRVGDRAVIRTQADIENGRFSPRIFELSGDRAVINAGEVDGLRPNQEAELYRGDEHIGTVRIVRVQRGYSVIAPAEAETMTWRLGDQLHFRPPPGTLSVAKIEDIVDETLFVARLTPSSAVPSASGPDIDPPLCTPLAICGAGETTGVALLLCCDGPYAVGLALEQSLTRPLRRGDVLSMEMVPPSATSKPAQKKQ